MRINAESMVINGLDQSTANGDRPAKHYIYNNVLAEEAEENTCSNCGTDDTCNVGTHGVHEEEVAGIGLLTLGLANAGSHRNGAHTG